MYQDERRLDFHALGREIKRKREAKGWMQKYLAQLVDRPPLYHVFWKPVSASKSEYLLPNRHLAGHFRRPVLLSWQAEHRKRLSPAHWHIAQLNGRKGIDGHGGHNRGTTKSSRRQWLSAVLSQHRTYRSVYGAFNSWRAQTDMLWLNHKSHCLSVFLLSLPCLLQLYALRTNVPVGYYPLALPSLWVLPSW